MNERRDVAALAAAIAEQLQGLHGYPPEHKTFVQLLLDERADSLVRRKRIQDVIAGSLILSGLIAFISWVGHAALQELAK